MMVTRLVCKVFLVFPAWVFGPVFGQDMVAEWVRTYGPNPTRHAKPAVILPTAEGGLVVAGSSENADGEPDYTVIKYDSSGKAIWTSGYASPNRKNDHLAGASLDEAGNVLVTGTSETVKFDRFGELLWAAPLAGETIAADRSFAYVTSPRGTGGYTTTQIGNDLHPPVDVILDADPGQDPDDLSDIAILNNLMSRGEVNILAVMGAHKSAYISANIEVVNRYYGHPEIPVAVAFDGPFLNENYGWNIWRAYRDWPGYSAAVPEAVVKYRQILASRPDGSVTIIFSGQLRNLLNLWKSTADAASPLYGPALLAKKVKRLIIVAGFFPSSHGHGEYNLATDTEAALVLNQISSVPVTFVGIEQGDAIKIPRNGVGRMDAENPVRYAHEVFGATNRPSWSGLGILLAARGPGWKGETYFSFQRGRITVAPNGANTFARREDSNQEYIQKTQPDSRYIDILEDLLMTPPTASPLPPETDRTGRELWSRTFHDGGLAASPKFIRMSGSGQIFVGGVEATTESVSRNHFVLHCYGEAGWLRWRARSRGLREPALSQIDLRSMEVKGGAVWLFGQYGGGGALFKFSKDGAQLWKYAFPSPSVAAKMIVDGSGMAYVVHKRDPATIAIAGVAGDGTFLGETVYRHEGAETFDVEALALDSAGNLNIAGGTSSGGFGSMALLRVDRGLTRVTATLYPSKYRGDARATGVVADSAGNIYLAGYQPTSVGGTEFFTIKYAPAFQMETLPSGGLRFRYHVAAHNTVTLEATEDFQEWQPVDTRRSETRGFLQLEDTNAFKLPTRFYRLKKEAQ